MNEEAWEGAGRKPDRLKPVLLGWRWHVNRRDLRVLLRLLPIRGNRIGSVWSCSVGIVPVRSGRGVRVRVYGRLAGNRNLPGRVPDEFPLLIRVASQINPYGRLLDLAPNANNISAQDRSFERLGLGL